LWHNCAGQLAFLTFHSPEQSRTRLGIDLIHDLPCPRAVIFEAGTFLGTAVPSHGEFEDLVLRWELDHLAEKAGAIHQRFRVLFLYLRDTSGARFDGRLLADLVVEEAARRVTAYRGREAFTRALEQAGFMIEEGQVRRTLPEAIDLPAADDEVHALLNRLELTTTLGHLDQAIGAHGRGDWAAANGQFRSFLESLFDEAAYLLVENANADRIKAKPGAGARAARVAILKS